VIAGRALRRWGRHAQAWVQLTAAVTVLRADLDADTVRALGELAAPEVHAGSADADALSAEALALGQDLAVDEATLAGLFDTRGLFHSSAGRNPQAAVYHQASARLAGQAGDPVRLGRALLNLSDAVIGTDPAADADADSLADIEVLACYRAWAAALRGDTLAAQAALAGLGDLRASEAPQDQAFIAVAEAFTAAALGQPTRFLICL